MIHGELLIKSRDGIGKLCSTICAYTYVNRVNFILIIIILGINERKMWFMEREKIPREFNKTLWLRDWCMHRRY
jgi:hypothetical protein